MLGSVRIAGETNGRIQYYLNAIYTTIALNPKHPPVEYNACLSYLQNFTIIFYLNTEEFSYCHLFQNQGFILIIIITEDRDTNILHFTNLEMS